MSAQSYTNIHLTPEKRVCPSSTIGACSRLNRLDVPVTGEAAPADRRHQQPASSALLVLTSLVDLNLAGNKFDAHSTEHSLGFFTKKGFPHLVHLDMRGSTLPAEEENRELLRIRAVCAQADPKTTQKMSIEFTARCNLVPQTSEFGIVEMSCEGEPTVLSFEWSQ